MTGVAHAFAQPLPFDYSYVGYRMSAAPIPDAPVRVYVPQSGGDQSARIQRAIDYVSSLKPDRRTGLRGAVLLGEGTYELSDALRLSASGVVLRGSGASRTVLLKKGMDRGAAVYIEGRHDRRVTDTLRLVADVPLDSRTLSVSGTLDKGEEFEIWRPSTAEWIRRMGCTDFGAGEKLGYWGWHPGDIDVTWTRTATTAGQTVTIDAPLSMALRRADGDIRVLRMTWQGRVSDSGVENLAIESDYDHAFAKDEDHCWDGVYVSAAKDCWVRMVTFRHLAGSAVVIQRDAQQVTVEDCKSYEPVSEIGGYRRRTFLTMGEKCLFQRCFSEEGIHDFAALTCAAGPNAFVQCESRGSLGFSGSVGPWATGLLFDNVNIGGNDLKLGNLGLEKYGTGWNTANSVAWQSTASGIFADSLPDGSNNYVYGCWAQFNGSGSFAECNNHVKPWSLFADRLSQRLGRNADDICRTYIRPTSEATSPTIEQAQQLALESYQPRVSMEMWIDSARLTASTDPRGVRSIDAIYNKVKPSAAPSAPAYAVRDGRLTFNGRLLAGGRHDVPWWNSRVRYATMARQKYGLTRFVPGQEGTGATDRIDSVVTAMKREHNVLINQNYGLWYDRRRDDHERVSRRDGDVWGPFYEQAFKRSGEGRAWDGLSRYDLSRLNGWYFTRLNEYARAAAPEGQVLQNQHYFQHNILEAGAHWVDCPWRSANNINHTTFPEPVPFASDKRIFMARQFYDVSDTVLRRLHHDYIFKSLDALAGNPNVIHSIGEEFTGPYHFVRFWLETIREWEQSRGRKALVSLAVNKDVQDSVLADAQLRDVVDIISIEQWFRNSKGLYAPPGGVNMAPRQYLRKVRTGSARFEDVYESVLEYRKAFPDKAVTYYAQKYPELAWASFMAGGSCPAIPVTDETFLADAAVMQPSGAMAGVYMMEAADRGAVVYIDADNKEADAALPTGTYDVLLVNSRDGSMQKQRTVRSADGTVHLQGKGIWWVRRAK